ncbi:Trp biosynthesis-associated membrane protein [Amorphoplanes digitatis]|uniref:Putative membrane protein (TIGR02234 family) n=1 Tax=Actinoplanes digitatis TaxID=1868 RepID=A0A7W7I2U0_9ACTN|nr:Trp biosynthesis-associated membrane protein [Actinoplanes digitatis]MBB4765414.1 putative membrane protein (TIGR02234 family) [Actinoplanes digitatis]GID93693.1 membrane protein [Actinoplanes digitatis]
MSPARRLTATVLLCAAGAGLTIYGVTRTWSEIVTERPGLSALRAVRTGADLEPWVIGLALVALAGAGALPATRGLPRRVLGGLLALAGLGIAAGAIAGRAGLDTGSAGAGATVWPVACVAGGLLILLGGLAAARYGHEWPGMGARYERGAARPDDDQTMDDDQAVDADQRVDTRAAWDALDRGEDPTAR